MKNDETNSFFLFSFTLLVVTPLGGSASLLSTSTHPTFVQIPIVLSKWKTMERTPPTLTSKLYEILAMISLFPDSSR